MSTTARRRHRTRRDLPVRRWLQLGAASAGVGAALLGWSLVGDQVGVAAAETSDGASASAGAADPAGERTTSSTTADDAAHEADAPKAGATGAENTKKSADRRSDDSDDDDDADLTGRNSHRVRASATTPANDADGSDESPAERSHAKTTTTKKPAGREQVVAWQIRDGVAAGQAAINRLPVEPAVKDLLTATLAATRRTFYNQAPRVSPVQITGKLDGPVTGTLGAVDPEGDRIVYRLTGKPKTGTVQINPDGTYTYTPGTDFTGVDTFTVMASDPGLHVNLLDPFRPGGTRAGNVINQRAITFDFAYRDGAQYWTPQARAALQTAADRMVPYFTVTAPVVLTFDVTGELGTSEGLLASAGSDFVSEDDGFQPTVVQHKMLTGVDANGSAADGEIFWNFGQPWAYGDVIGDDEYDFDSTAMHELMHTLGFLATLEGPGANADTTTWSAFDGFIVTASGDRVIDPDDYTFNSAYDPKLTGPIGDGLFFGGPEAVAAYGGLVPLFTMRTWLADSSATHLDDRVFTGAAAQLMNAATDTGPSARALSAIELGMLRDLGYTVSALPTAPAPTAALALVGLVFLRRPKRR